MVTRLTVVSVSNCFTRLVINVKINVALSENASRTRYRLAWVVLAMVLHMLTMNTFLQTLCCCWFFCEKVVLTHNLLLVYYTGCMYSKMLTQYIL